jgi:hypothetical protein
MHLGIVTVWTPLLAIKRSTPHFEPSKASSEILNQPPPMPESVFGHYGAFVRGVDDVVGARGEGVAPGEGCAGAGLEGYDGGGFSSGVGSAVAYDVVG